MISTGIWKGQYKYDDKLHQKLKGIDSTNFEIIVTSTANERFNGTVQDDLATGGTEGIGEIVGKVSGDKIEFIKQMPVMTLVVDKKGTRKTFNKKQRKIYYTGTFSDDRKIISGEWKFKFGFIWIGIIPIPVQATKGIWTMRLAEEVKST